MSKSDPAAPGVRNALAAAEASCPGISLGNTIYKIRNIIICCNNNAHALMVMVS